MIEIFKTNVHCDHQAACILAQIKDRFPLYQANFDLDDCDRVLRICCADHQIEHTSIIHIMQDHGYLAEILPDVIPAGFDGLVHFTVTSR